jgi:hypothetical protein
MILVRLLTKILDELIARCFLALDFLWSYLAFTFSPYGWLAGPQQRMRECQVKLESPAQGPSGAGPEKLCIMVIYANHLSESTRLTINLWNSLDFKVLLVNNAALVGGDQEQLAALAWRVFERINIGQDIGAFKDAILWLLSKGYLDTCSALAITNDSLQWIPGRNATQLATEIRHFLDSTDQEALFSHVSYQVCRHYQSFFQLLKPSVFRSRPFSDFWLAYQPISNRRHCILKGEIGLSKKVYNDLTKVKVLYSTEALYECLLAGPLAQQGFPAEELLAWMPSVYRTQRLKIHNPALDVLLHAAQRGAHLPASQLACLADLIESNNPTHVAAFLYPAYLDCPFVKKDLCFAGSFTLAQAIHLYRAVLTSSLGHPQIQSSLFFALMDEYGQTLYAKGTPLGHQFAKFAALRKGLKVGFVYSPTFIL